MASRRPQAHRAEPLDRSALEKLYRAYNDKRYFSCDPIECVHRYGGRRDREVAAIVASSLAFGGIAQIRVSIGRVLDAMGDSPAGFLRAARANDLEAAFRGFKHRWITGGDMASMLGGVKRAMDEYGTLGGLFLSRLESSDRDVGPAAGRFVEEIRRRSGGFRRCLLPSPRDGSACKRLLLFLRWMVRKDEIDTGLWSVVPASMLLVPLDVHMHRIARGLGLTRRTAANLAAVREVTDGFRAVSPDDPVRYDFALTHADMLGVEVLHRGRVCR